jgi:hypothetical protein
MRLRLADVADELLALRDLVAFGEVRAQPELHTVTWPNGADFSPEFLQEKVRAPA